MRALIAPAFGPAASSSQYATVMEYVEPAHRESARVVTGGRADDDSRLGAGLADGEFIEPIVFADVTPDMRIAREEIFGPVIPILKYDDSTGMAEAIHLANNTGFGLGGLVFGADEQRALEVARAVDSGSVGINFFGSNHAAPFGGRHNSGVGVEYGIEGLNAYLSPKSVHRRTDRH